MDSSRVAGYEGAERAALHAERAIPTWKATAKRKFEEFLIASGPGSTFVAHDVARWCVANGLPEPPDARAWGNLIRLAAKSGVIEDTKLRPRAGSHGREVPLWRIV